MHSDIEEMSESLVRIFENVLLTEEKSLSRGYFSDLSLAEMHTLTAIGPYEAKTMSQTAQSLGITTGTLTVSIDRLVKKGYVIRRRDDRDKRIVRISLTKDRDKLLVLVKQIDVHVAELLARYEGAEAEEKIRSTAKEIADNNNLKDKKEN